MPERPAGSLFRTPDGRVRVGWRLTLFVVLGVGLAVAGGVVLSLARLGGEDVARASAPVLFGALVAGWVLLEVEDRSWTALGFHRGPGMARETGLGLALGIAPALVTMALIGAVGGLSFAGEGGSAWEYGSLGLGVAGVLLIPAAAEEALFRGYPFQALVEAFGAVPVVAVFALGFGLLHLGNENASLLGAVSTGVAGAFLSVLYLRTGSLWLVTGAHLGWNWALGFLADVPVSGIRVGDTPMYDVTVGGPTWLSGGEFGPEGGLVAAVVIAAFTAWAWRTRLLEPSGALEGSRPLCRVRENR